MLIIRYGIYIFCFLGLLSWFGEWSQSVLLRKVRDVFLGEGGFVAMFEGRFWGLDGKVLRFTIGVGYKVPELCS